MYVLFSFRFLKDTEIIVLRIILYFLGLACRILDNLPVAVLWERGERKVFYERGFRVGVKGKSAGVSFLLHGS